MDWDAVASSVSNFQSGSTKPKGIGAERRGNSGNSFGHVAHWNLEVQENYRGRQDQIYGPKFQAVIPLEIENC
jgi:hypothetical protein